MRNEPNPWVGKNYIPDNQRMEVPPAYFLQRIWDQDAMLVLLPSRRVPFAYVVARRKQFTKGLTERAIDSVYTNPDTKMCILHGCVPVCLIYKNSTSGSWNPDPVIATLQARDIWAHGGADKVADMLEAREDADRAKIQKQNRDDLYNRSGDAWRSYQNRTGQSTIRTKDFRTVKKATDIKQPSASSESTAGSGLFITER